MAFVLKTVTIRNGTAASQTIKKADLSNDGTMAFVGVFCPSSVDAATTLALQHSPDGGTTFYPQADATGAAKTITQAASKYISVAAADYPCLPGDIQLITSGNVAADRTYILVFRSV